MNWDWGFISKFNNNKVIIILAIIANFLIIRLSEIPILSEIAFTKGLVFWAIIIFLYVLQNQVFSFFCPDLLQKHQDQNTYVKARKSSMENSPKIIHDVLKEFNLLSKFNEHIDSVDTISYEIYLIEIKSKIIARRLISSLLITIIIMLISINGIKIFNFLVFLKGQLA